MQTRKRQRGSAMIESALIFSAFMLMLIGIADFGQFLFLHNGLTERARSAVRYGITLNPIDTAKVKNMMLYGSATVPESEDEGDGPPPSTFMNLTSSNVVVQELGAGTEDHRLKMQVIGYQYLMLSPLIFGTKTSPTITIELPLPQNE